MRRRMRFSTLLLLCVGVALFLSLPAAALVSRVSAWTDAAGEQTGMAQMLSRLSREKNLSAQDLASRDFRGPMHVSVAEALPAWSAEEAEAFARDGIVTIQGRDGEPVTFLRLNDAVLRLSGSHSGRTFWRVFRRALVTISIPIGGFLLLTGLLLRGLLRWFRGLSDASEQLQTGNYGIHLREDMYGEAGAINQRMNRLAEELRTADQRDSQLLSQVSHELRTPLASIRGYAQLMGMEGLSPAERDAFAGIIADESGRLGRVTDRLLRLAELSTHRSGQLHIEPCSLDESWRRVLAAADSCVQAEVLDSVTVLADPDLLQLIWQCVLEGLPEGARTWVYCRENDGRGTAAVRCLAPVEHLDALPVLRRAAALCGGRMEEQHSPGTWQLTTAFPLAPLDNLRASRYDTDRVQTIPGGN